MADQNLSKWVGGSRFVKLKKWGNGINNSATPTGRKSHYRCGTQVSTIGRMQCSLHEYCKAKQVRMDPHGVPFF